MAKLTHGPTGWNTAKSASFTLLRDCPFAACGGQYMTHGGKSAL
jgi:hypothetical protein